MDNYNNLKNKSLEEKIKKIWNDTYTENNREELGWYETIPEPSLSLIKKYSPDKNKLILDAGCGESTLINALTNSGFKDIMGIDLSSNAINFLKENTILKEHTNLSLEVANLTEHLFFNKKGILWHDRAVFHFIENNDFKKIYKDNLIKFLEQNGIFIIACFSKENTTDKCNGFPVNKYTVEELNNFFSDSFLLLENFTFQYTTPWNDIRDYIYCVFKKIN